VAPEDWSVPGGDEAPGVTVRRLPADAARDPELVEQISALANEVYAVAEAGFWQPGAARTTPEEIAAAIRAVQLIVAMAGTVVGVIRTQVDGPDASFGMLAVDPAHRDRGVGRRLVRAAEDGARRAGAEQMHLEVLTPTARESGGKAELGRWYERLGYRYAGDLALHERYPDLVPELAVPCHLRLYRRPLAPSGA